MPSFLTEQVARAQSAVAGQPELSWQRVAGASLRRAECADQSRDRPHRCVRAGVGLVQSVRGLLRLSPQHRFIEGQELAAPKDDASADHDGVNGSTVFGKYQLS